VWPVKKKPNDYGKNAEPEKRSAQALLDHEIAVAHLETLTGATLR
jgi:hypothetical protein